jgi:iron complex outermembrane receptor protein
MKSHFLTHAAFAVLILSYAGQAAAQQAELETQDEIIVTGSPLGRSIDETITGVSVLSGDELLDRLSGTLGETLKTEPGVSSTFFGAGASRPIIRGQGGDRVRVLTNGIGSIDASSASPDHAVAAEPAQAERIEVIRGAGLLRFGSSGSGGVVNVIDGRIPNEVPDSIDGAVRIGASSVDSGREAAASVDIPTGDNLVLHLDGTFRETDNYNIPGQERLDNSATESHALTGGLSYVGERGFLGAAVHSFNTNYGVPGDPDEQVSIALDQTRVDINGAIKFGGLIEKLQLFGGYADYTHTEFEAPGEPGTVFTNQGGEIRLEALQAEHGGWAAAYGAQYRRREFAAIGDEAFVPPTNTDQYGIYTFQEIERGELHFEGAARFETTKHENTGSGETRSFDLLSLSGGGDVHLNDNVRLGGTVFRTERAPTTEELFSNGPHLATNQFELGDIDLGKEIATGIEAAFRHRVDGHYITVNAFYTDYQDYIFEIETGATQDDLPVFQFSAEDASFKGFEVLAGANLGEFNGYDISVDGLVEYVRAKTDSDNLPRIPPLSVLAGMEAENERFKFRAELDYAASQNQLAAFETTTEDFALFNVFATWKAPIGTQDVRLKLSVLNLFDTDARQHTSFLKDVVPLPGRNIRFSVAASF